mgnify:CR=1 FL=1
MEAFRILNGGKFQFGWLTYRAYGVTADFLSALVVADSFQLARFESDLVERKEEVVLPFTNDLPFRKSSTSWPVDTTCTGFTVFSG